MSFYYLTPLVAFTFNLILALLVLQKDWKNPLYRILFLFLISVACWSFAIYAMRSSPDIEVALWRERFVLASVPLVGLFYYHFASLITDRKPKKGLLLGVYALSFLFTITALMGLQLQGMEEKYYGFAPVLTPLNLLLLLWTYSLVGTGLFLAIRTYRSSQSRGRRRQFAYIIVGTCIFFVGTLTDVAPSFGFRSYPLGTLTSAIFCLLCAISIARYNLLGLPIVRKGLAYTLVSGLVAGIYVVVILLISAVFRLTEISLGVSVVVVLIIAIILQPVLRWSQKAVDRWFYRERYNQLKALEEFSSRNHFITNIEQESSSLVNLIQMALQSSGVHLLMPRGRRRDFFLVATTDPKTKSSAPRLGANVPIVRWLKNEAGFLFRKDIEVITRLQGVTAKDKHTLDELGAEFLVPLETANDLVGILLLGPKLSGEEYSQDDNRVLTLVSRQVSVALENARLYKEAREALRELQKTQDRLLRTERLRAVGEVAAGVGHDLRNLLTVVVGRAELALERVQHNGKLKRDLKVIEQAALDGAEVVNRLQSFTKVGGDLSFDLVDMNRLLLDALQMVEPRLSQQREMEDMTTDVIVNLGEAEPVKGKPSELREMLTNILVNAIEAMPRGGKLTITSRQENDSVVISIEDTGVGIASKVRKRIFESFYTTKGPQGVGLGLSIAHGVVKSHGGDIRLSSKLGKGSTFTVRLPVSKQRRARQAVSGKAHSVTRKTAALIIDNNKAVREVLSEILESDGYNVDAAGSGKKGLAFAERKDYAVVMVDLGMPDMSGRDVAKAVNTMKPATPIFLVTGWDVELQPAELIDWGVTGVITKPFTKTNVLAQIKRCYK